MEKQNRKQHQPVILLMNGPNLNMLGKRSKKHYGSFTLEQVEIAFKVKAEALGVGCAFVQSNHEGELVSEIHKAMDYAAGIVINAGAHTHYSYAILDALELCGLPVMEVHISNIHQREPFRRVSVINNACVGQVYGLGMDSYLVGLEKLVKEHIFSKKEGFARLSQDTPSEELSELRTELTNIDGELMEIFNRRMAISERVGQYKKRNAGRTVYDAKREDEVIELACQRSDSELKGQVNGLMKTILRTSRERQYAILMPEDDAWEIGKKIRTAKDTLDFIGSVAYGGTHGSYSEMAAEKLFPNADKVAVPTFPEACARTEKKEVVAAVLPLENTTAGTVDDVYGLLQNKDMYIVAAGSVRVRHKLSVVPGTKLSDVKTIISHPQGLAQCSEEIKNQGWEIQTAGNTAFAAEQVAKRKDKTVAAIASEEAAIRNGLEILPVEISNSTFNHTRFVALSNQPVITKTANRISILMHLPHSSGSLASALEVFSDYGLNLCSIFSRPIPETPWEYAFFLDFLCDSKDENALLSMYQLSAEMPYMKFLGWYEDIG